MARTTGIPEVSTWSYLSRARGILRNPLPFHRDMFQSKGDTFKLRLGLGREVIFSRDPAFAAYVLQKNQRNYIKSEIQTKDMAKYLGHGLLTAEGELWRTQRKLIQPAFHKAKLLAVLDKVHQAILQELRRIEAPHPIRIFPIFNDLAFQTVVKALFSEAASSGQISRLQFITEAAQRMLVRELRQPYLGWWFQLSGAISRHLKLTAEARQLLQQIIDRRKDDGQSTGDLLDMLLEARYEDGSRMSNKQLLDEILIIFTAGHETTSNALTFISQLLANHPLAQELIAQEVSQARASTADSYAFLSACTYTRKVVEEGLRLYPPAYFIDRVNLEDDNFEGKQYEKNTSILFSLYEIHRHRQYWKSPEQFDPERPELGNNGAFFPFGAGPRKCIGSNLAMYEMVLTIAELASRYRIKSTSDQMEIRPLITLKPGDPELIFEPR